jgi:cytoskeletal protein RodZ
MNNPKTHRCKTQKKDKKKTPKQKTKQKQKKQKKKCSSFEFPVLCVLCLFVLFVFGCLFWGFFFVFLLCLAPMRLWIVHP